MAKKNSHPGLKTEVLAIAKAQGLTVTRRILPHLGGDGWKVQNLKLGTELVYPTLLEVKSFLKQRGEEPGSNLV